MKRALSMVALVGVAVLACSKSSSDSVVYVTVTAPAGLMTVTQLRVSLAYAGKVDTELFPQTNSTKAISFVPAATFVLDLPSSASGSIDISIDALDSLSKLVSHGENAARIVAGGRIDVTIVLDSGNDFDGGVPVVDASGTTGTGGVTGTGEVGSGDLNLTGAGGADAAGFGGGRFDAVIAGNGGAIGTDPGGIGAGGVMAVGGSPGADAKTGTGGSSVVVPSNNCGNGIRETNEVCDCGTDPKNLPSGCKAVNGLFYGDGSGCSKTCTKEPTCVDGSGKTQACTSACGDGNLDPGEDCDDGNLADGDGCSKGCKKEPGFTCTTFTHQDSSTCTSGTGQCLEMPIVYRDFQPENVSAGGHPDFYFLGTKANGSTAPTTICVPNSGGPSKGNDSTARCWDIPAADLQNGKPVYNSSRASNTCACQFSDWTIGNASHIPGGYTQTDSPLSAGFVVAPAALNTTTPSGSVTGQITGYTSSTPGGPIWKGTVPIVKDAASFKQWFTDDPKVNQTFTGVLEMPQIASNVYQYASKTHLAGPDAGFFPLDTLNASQATMCSLWPYWNRANGSPIWATCTGDQYFFPPRVIQPDCPNQNPLSNGCWVSATPGTKHDAYFTTEARYFFVYDSTAGLTLQFFGSDDLFVFINGKLVLDLGGVHQQLPGKVTVAGDPGVATIAEGGCLDAAGAITGVTAGSTACSPTNSKPPAAVSPDDFRNRTVNLGLNNGKVYEIAIFGANRNAFESDYQITLSGFTTKRSVCVKN